MRRFLQIVLFISTAAFTAVAQQTPQQPPGFGGGPPGGRDRGPGGRFGESARDRMEGKWWYNPRIVQRLGLSTDQQKKLEDIFQQNRVKLIGLAAALEKEQAILDPLISAEHPQESRVLAQFDRVSDARHELEKANARMLWGFRTVLTADQWKQLQPEEGGPPGPPPSGRGPLR